jgi:hypothetical protein
MMVASEMILSVLLALAPPASEDSARPVGGPLKLSREMPAVTEVESRYGYARLSLIRADGVELAWIESRFSVPTFPDQPVLPDRVRFEAPWLDDATGVNDRLGRSVRVEIDRDTALRDGGISGEHAMVGGDDGLVRLASVAGGEGEYDIYDLSMTWDAFTPGPLTVSLIGGLRAIDARIGKVVREGDDSSFRDARGVVAVPVIGGGISWRLSEEMSFSGTASTHTFTDQGTMLDLAAETSIRLTPNIGFFAGYQFIRSAIEVQSLEADLEREGIFARLQIRF